MSKDNKQKRSDKKPQTPDKSRQQVEATATEAAPVAEDKTADKTVEPAAKVATSVEPVATEAAVDAKDKAADKTAGDKAGTGKTDDGKPAVSDGKQAAADKGRKKSGNGKDDGRSAQREQPPAQAQSSGGGKGLSVLALLVALASAGFSGWVWYQDQQKPAPAPAPEPVAVVDHGPALQQQEQQLQKLAQQVGGYQDQLNSLKQDVGKLPSSTDLGENQRLLQQLQSAHQAFSLRFESAFGNTRQDWRLAEAEHLMRMAHLRLTALHDLNSARHLLEAADQILFEQDDPAAYAAREALADALANVRAMPKLDRAGVFMRLGALQRRVGELDQMLPGFTPGESNVGKVEWGKLLDKASNYIRLDINSTEDIKPLLSSQQLTHIRLAVSLALEQAQWAALNGEQEVYSQALAQGIELLQHYFAESHQAAASMRTQLEELTAAKVSQAMPDINPALVALQGYIQERTLERRAPKEGQQ